MSAAIDPLALATEAQQRATTPGHSAWVEANAGTGKTKVLTDRVTRLLLDGVKPERILCLTFTKAAAAEMRNRLASQLGRWALADPDKLDEQIEALINRTPQPAERVGARRLFARVLDAPGGINILTIHAFCQALLKRFPLEAGVAPGFEVLDEAEAQTLLRHAQDEQMEALARRDAPPTLVEALASVAGKISIAEYADLMTKLLGERAWLLARIGDEAGLRRVRARLADEMGCSPDDTAGGLTSQACLEAAFDAAALGAAARALAKGGKTDVSRARLIADWLADAEGRPSHLPAYSRAFFTDKGSILKRLATKAAIEAMPDIEKVLQQEAERLATLLDRVNGAPLFPRQATARGARLRRPDRGDAAPSGERSQCGVGALQTGRRHRPCAGRRGAGHQPRPMGGDPAADRGILRRPGRGRAQPHGVRRRRHQAVDLRLPARRSAQAQGNA
jgi:ATP-dependent helicase/nuclease subunit A